MGRRQLVRTSVVFAAVVAVVAVAASLAGVAGSGGALQVRSSDIVDGTIKSQDISGKAVKEIGGFRGVYEVDLAEGPTGTWTANYPYEYNDAAPTLTYGSGQSGVMDALVKFARRDQIGVLSCNLAAVGKDGGIWAQSSDRINWSNPGDDTLTLRTLTDTASGTQSLRPKLTCSSTAQLAGMHASLIMESTSPGGGMIP